MNYRNICFSCHSYIGDYIVEILKEVDAVDSPHSITPTLDLMDLGKSETVSFVKDWLDGNDITKLCCRDAIRDAANMKEFDRKTNLNKL